MEATTRCQRPSCLLVPPDPNPFRQELPVEIRRAYEWGWIDAREVWRRCERLLGTDGLAPLLEEGREA